MVTKGKVYLGAEVEIAWGGFRGGFGGVVGDLQSQPRAIEKTLPQPRAQFITYTWNGLHVCSGFYSEETREGSGKHF